MAKDTNETMPWGTRIVMAAILVAAVVDLVRWALGLGQ